MLVEMTGFILAIFLIFSLPVDAYAVENGGNTAKCRTRSFFLGNLDARRLLSSSASDIVGLIGKPVLKRVDYPAEIWLYRCEYGSLFIFFDNKGDKPAVRYIEARDKNDELVPDIDVFLKRNF